MFFLSIGGDCAPNKNAFDKNICSKFLGIKYSAHENITRKQYNFDT